MIVFRFAFLLLAFSFAASIAQALELDWSGQFRSEADVVRNYAMENGNSGPAAPAGAGGYTVQPGGNQDASFQTLFMRLEPKAVVNDNIFLKSEFWLGNPVYGFYGNGVPYNVDEHQYYSTQSAGSTITAQRFWAEIQTEVGTVQVGRAPLDWGLGIIWNSGDGLWDHYESTGDQVRLISKFGAFTFEPSFVKYSMGNSIGGNCFASSNGTCNNGLNSGGGGVTDFSFIFKYDNPDEDFDVGLNFIKRIAYAAQDPTYGYFGAGSAIGSGMNYNTWDIYGKKKWGKFTLGGELPITSGSIGSLNYSTWALALEGDMKWSDSFDMNVKAGHAPGQAAYALSNGPQTYSAFFFNPDYHIALIMFNFQLNNFAGPNAQNAPQSANGTGGTYLSSSSLVSPYDNPITNANYLHIGGAYHVDRWSFKAAWTYAHALNTALKGQGFMNTNTKTFVTSNSGGTNNGAAKDQSSSLGWEMDYGVGFKWDDNFTFGFDFGWWYPGQYYAFSNTAADNNLAAIFSAELKAGISF